MKTMVTTVTERGQVSIPAQIGAFATTRQGLLTRNPADFAVVFPSLTVVTPETPP